MGPKAADREVRRWNAKCPIGTAVRYWPLARMGPGIVSKTRTLAQVNSAGRPVVWIEGEGGCMSLTHVAIVPAEWLNLPPEGSWWMISIGGGYGQFLYGGTEAEAEDMRCHKARWEQAKARKWLATPEEVTTHRPGACMSEGWGKWLAGQEAP